jgi:uncharacterized protein
MSVTCTTSYRQRDMTTTRALSCARASSTTTSVRHRQRLNVAACRHCRHRAPVSVRQQPSRRAGVCAGAKDGDDEDTRASSSSSSSGANDRDESSKDEEDTVTMKVAMGLLDFYKREISPLLPKSCRFVPTCSEYARQAYKKYGTSKGFVLTAWRLMRCNPLGDKGYDPPMWPPPYLGSDPASLD